MLLVLPVVLGAGCGGGGGGPLAPPPVLDLGTQPSTVDSRVVFLFKNPLSTSAIVTEASAGLPFHIDPADLPTTVPAGGSVGLGVVFEPAAPGPATGDLTLSFEGGGQTAASSFDVTAMAEPVTWDVAPPLVSFGAVAVVGDTVLRSVSLANLSKVSPVTFSTVSLPPGGFSLVPGQVPVVIGPGATKILALRYQPLVAGNVSGNLRLGDGEPGGPVVVALSAGASTKPAEIVTDFGSQALNNSGGVTETATLTVNVPADAIALNLEASRGVNDTFGLGLLTGPGGTTYENAQSTGNYIWLPGQEVFTAGIPNTDRSNVQLVAGGGDYTFRIRRLGGSATTVDVRAIVERRDAAQSTGGVLDLNVWLANAITPKAATAATDTPLQNVLSGIDAILGVQGFHLGAIDYYDVTDPTYDKVTEAEFPQLLQLSSAASKVRLNLFFVQEALGGGVLGVAATISGPKKNGTTVSGVMSLYGGGYSDTLVALVGAHEIGHYVGLYHPVEQDGSHDFIDDTTECPATGACVGGPAGGGYLMHWQAVGGTSITNGQALVVRGHPLFAPPGGGSSKPRSRYSAEPIDPSELSAVGNAWCGTCTNCRIKGK